MKNRYQVTFAKAGQTVTRVTHAENYEDAAMDVADREGLGDQALIKVELDDPHFFKVQVEVMGIVATDQSGKAFSVATDEPS